MLTLLREFRLFLQAASCSTRYRSIDFRILDADPKSTFLLQVESLLHFPHLMRKCQGVHEQSIPLRRRVALTLRCLGRRLAGLGGCVGKDTIGAGSDESVCSGRPSPFGLGVVLALNERNVLSTVLLIRER